MTENRLIEAVVLFVLAQSFTLGSGFIFFAIIGHINERIAQDPQTRRISYLGFNAQKLRRVSSEYERLYPDGKLMIYFWTCFALAMFFLLGTAWRLGFFS